MRVSFDIDDTLVCGPDVPCEPPPPLWRRWRAREPLRLGSRRLMAELIGRGCEV